MEVEMHLVNRLRVEVVCSAEEQAFALRQNFAQTFLPEIFAAIDQVCSAYAAEDEQLRIDTLELDLGCFSPHTFARDFACVFRERFEKELAKKLHALTPEQRKTSRQHSLMALLRHFILQGSLPWWSNENEADIDAIVQELYALAPEQLRAFFYDQRENRAVWIRTALQLRSAARSTIISLIDELQDAEFRLLRWIEACMADDFGYAAQNNILEAVRGVLLLRAPEIIKGRENAAAVLHVFADATKGSASFRAVSRTKLAQSAFSAVQLPAKSGSPEEPGIGFLSAAFHGHEESTQAVRTAVDALINDAQGLNIEYLPGSLLATSLLMDDGYIRQGGASLSPHVDAGMEQRYVICHSGVILFAPFFRKFFDACGLLDGMEWKNKNTQYQAVHLLKYLTTGSKKTPEYSLTLEKLCCGIAVEEPIPINVGLQTHQLDEVQALLASAIGHWKALKNTSVDGLRETFLKRDGLITRKNDGWLLQVERKTLDVLLDSIPWGYSMVALPWNGYLIHVEW